jgi:hypothetical protein
MLTVSAGWGFAIALVAAAPPELERLLAVTVPRGTLAAWCELSKAAPNAPRRFALQIGSPGGGEYLVVQAGASAQLLTAYEGAGELACHTPEQARALDRAIRRSQTLQGGLRPRGSGAVVCGFTSATTAVCWQAAPAGGRWLRVGGWST